MALTDKLTAIANAIRAKTGGTAAMTLAEMPSKIAGIKTKSTYTWNQCPVAVKNYLANVTYDPSDYTTSQIANYAPATAVASNTKPIGKTVDGVTYYNEVPNVATPFASANEAGTLKPLDRLRWINSQTDNMRDLGGWACDGGTVKYGKLFRGAEPDAADKALAEKIGIKHELNLRGDEVPLRTTSVWGIGYTQFKNYTWYVDNSAVWMDILRTIFDCVLHNIPLYYHCAAGADRTGSVSLVIEALLGVSQSDCDKDYELTCFSTGTNTDENARRRNETPWQNNINYINSITLPVGVADTFRNRVIYFVASHGITEDELNAFRSAMIDGNPDTITLVLNEYTVAKSGTNITYDNAIASVDEYQPYEVNFVADDGYAISAISVTMGGVDITGKVLDGKTTNRRVSVTKNLTHCTIDNTLKTVIAGQSFGATISASEGYTLDGGTIQISMGGVDMSAYYSNGKISIPNVTGNIVITATAVPSAPAYENKLISAIDTSGNLIGKTPLHAGARWNSSSGTTEDTYYNCTGLISAKRGDTVRVRWSGGGSDQLLCIKPFKNDKSQAYNGYLKYATINSTYASSVLKCDIPNGVMDFVVPSATSIPATTEYLSFALYGALTDVIITVNEEIE